MYPHTHICTSDWFIKRIIWSPSNNWDVCRAKVFFLFHGAVVFDEVKGQAHHNTTALLEIIILVRGAVAMTQYYETHKLSIRKDRGRRGGLGQVFTRTPEIDTDAKINRKTQVKCEQTRLERTRARKKFVNKSSDISEVYFLGALLQQELTFTNLIYLLNWRVFYAIQCLLLLEPNICIWSVQNNIVLLRSDPMKIND
jgi:hypothetical protein